MSLSNNDNKTRAILSIAVVWLYYLFSYMARVEPSVLTNDLMSDFKITASTVGLVISMMYIPYVAMQIPFGVILDKFGVRKIIVTCALLCSFGAYIFGSAESVFQLQIGRFLVGLSSASAFISCGKIAGDMFDKRYYSILMGIAMCMGCLGGIFGTSPIAYLVSIFGWRWTTYIISFSGIFVALLAFFGISSNNMENNHQNKENKSDLLTGLKMMAKNPRSWILGLYGAITYLPLSAIAELWGVPFMEQRFNVSTKSAALSSIVIFIGFGLGGVVGAWVAERINSYKKTIIIFTIGVIISFAIALYSDNIGYTLCLIMMFLGGIFAGANTLAFTIAFHMVPKKYSGTSAGFLNMLIMSSGIIFQPLLGKLLDFFRNGMVNDSGSPIYNLQMYRSTFFIVIISMFIAIILTFFIEDVRHSNSPSENNEHNS